LSYYNKLINKFKRYSHLVSNFQNWHQFIGFKIFAKEGDSFTFKLRHSFPIRVERKMLGPFRDCFFDEKYLKNIEKKVLKDKELAIVDIGANVGYFSLYALYKFPKARVFAFEPMPYCFRELHNYCTEFNNSSFSVHNYAVGKEDGMIDFYVQNESQFSTESSIHPGAGKQKVQVRSIRWETLRKLLDLNHIHLLKLDCEGSEYDILYNLKPEDFARIDCITMEAHNVNYESGNMLTMVQFLRENNFEVTHEAILKNAAGGHIWANRKM
jgi:FkbM family methyltransferase